MTPWFAATERFNPSSGESPWAKYIAWSGLTQLEELVTLDPMLNPPVLKEMKDEYWTHAVNEDFMYGYFLARAIRGSRCVGFLRAQLAGVNELQLALRLPEPGE